MLEDAFARGLGSYEFLGKREPWKMDWAREARPLEWLSVCRDDARGRLLHGVKFRALPWLRQAVAPRLRTGA